MGHAGKLLVMGAAAAAGAIVVRRKRSGSTSEEPRRHAVTVNRPLHEVTSHGRLPSPLADIAEGVELEFRPAPGDRGTEIYATSKGEVGEGAIRRALRDTRSLVECGDVLLPDGPSTTEPTLLNKPLRAVTRRGREEGLL